MNKNTATVAIIALGLAGLYFNVDYAGWVLFIGILLTL